MSKLVDEQKKAGLFGTVESIADIPINAAPGLGWKLSLTVQNVMSRETVHGKPYYLLRVKDKAGLTFSIVVWNHQWNRQGPFEEGEERELTVKVPRGDYSAWHLY